MDEIRKQTHHPFLNLLQRNRCNDEDPIRNGPFVVLHLILWVRTIAYLDEESLHVSHNRPARRLLLKQALILVRLRSELHGLIDFRERQINADLAQRKDGVQAVIDFPDEAAFDAAHGYH